MAIIRYIFKKLWHWWGWRLEGDPNKVPKKIYVVIPHTSNWDFPVGYMLKVWHKLDVRWIAKSQMFRWPFGGLFRAMGGIPVDREKARNFIPTMIELYDQHSVFSTAIAPEGTRKKVDRLKSGYYRIATGANIPIVYVKFDWGNKICYFADPKMPADTWEEELQYVTDFFHGVQGYIPEYGYPFEE